MVSNTIEGWQHSIYTPEHKFKGLNHWVKIDANLISYLSYYFNLFFIFKEKIKKINNKNIFHSHENSTQKILKYMYNIFKEGKNGENSFKRENKRTSIPTLCPV